MDLNARLVIEHNARDVRNLPTFPTQCGGAAGGAR
jgi:hypothetical protein